MFTRQNGLTLEEYKDGHNTTKILQWRNIVLQKIFVQEHNTAKLMFKK